MTAMKQGYPSDPVLLKTDLCQQSYGQSLWTNQVGPCLWTLEIKTRFKTPYTDPSGRLTKLQDNKVKLFFHEFWFPTTLF